MPDLFANVRQHISDLQSDILGCNTAELKNVISASHSEKYAVFSRFMHATRCAVFKRSASRNYIMMKHQDKLVARESKDITYQSVSPTTLQAETELMIAASKLKIKEARAVVRSAQGNFGTVHEHRYRTLANKKI